MGKTYRRPPIKQHKELLEEGKYHSRVEKNKKKENKNKHPKQTPEYWELFGGDGDRWWSGDVKKVPLSGGGLIGPI